MFFLSTRFESSVGKDRYQTVLSAGREKKTIIYVLLATFVKGQPRKLGQYQVPADICETIGIRYKMQGK